MLHAIIMAGGSGTRFWPASRRALPKQFLAVQGDESLIQAAFQRAQPLIPASRTWVVTNQKLDSLTREHLPELPADHLLLEPAARNTAPCVALAAQCLLAEDPDALMLVMPADQIIHDTAAFQRDVELAVRIVQHDPQQLVLFGIPPTSPATGFGYIEQGTPGPVGGNGVASFREKPNRAVAEEYVRSGKFLWNAGIFVWSARRVLDCLRTHEPQILETLEPLVAARGTGQWTSELQQHFPQAKAISVDYAVLERERTISVVAATFDWDDLGSWEALSRLLPADDQQNVSRGQFVGVKTSNCIVQSGEGHVVATLGVDNLIIVHTPDATLVAQRGDEEAVREVIRRLEELGLRDVL